MQGAGNAEITLADGAGRSYAAADEGGSCAVYRAVEALRPSGAKFHHTAALSGADNPVGFCGDQASMVDAQKQHGFNKFRFIFPIRNKETVRRADSRQVLIQPFFSFPEALWYLYSMRIRYSYSHLAFRAAPKKSNNSVSGSRSV